MGTPDSIKRALNIEMAGLAHAIHWYRTHTQSIQTVTERTHMY